MIRKASFMFMGSVVACAAVWADVPQTINHQGLVTVSGTRFDGTGQFKFAILNASGVNVWTNDNSNLVLNGVPNTHEDVPVQDGIYSVLLGGTTATYTMTPIPPSIFNAAGMKLRIFFNDGVNGFQSLTPDHLLASSPYSHQAQFQPPIGSIIAWHKSFANTPPLPEGWMECNGQTVIDPKSPYDGQVVADLNNTPSGGYTAGGRFLRGGTTSGAFQDATAIWDKFEGFGGAAVPSNDDLITKNRDGGALFGTSWDPLSVSGPVQSTTVEFDLVRPVNMSIVWIIRVK